MDDELRGKAASRKFDTVDEQQGANTENEEIAEGSHVLNNLLQSLEASAGTPGPVPNMLKAMGGGHPD
jgi:hypothetical protein